MHIYVHTHTYLCVCICGRKNVYVRKGSSEEGKCGQSKNYCFMPVLIIELSSITPAYGLLFNN